MVGVASGLGVDRGASGEGSDRANVSYRGEGDFDISRYILTRGRNPRDCDDDLPRSRKTGRLHFATYTAVAPRGTELFFDKALALASVRIKPLHPTRDPRRLAPTAGKL